MDAIHSIQTVTGPTLSISVPADLQGKKVEIVVTPLLEELTESERQKRLAALIGEKPKLSPELETQLADNPDLLKGSVLRYDDPFGPACPPEDWEALS